MGLLLQNRKHQFFAEFMLVTVTLFWGATFPIVKDAIGEMPVMAFLWVRFAMAAVLLALIAGRAGFATLDRRGWRLGVFLEPVSWPQQWTGSLIFAFLITSVFATAYAFWAMTTFQNRTTPTRAALIYTLEPVFAAIFCIWLAGDRLTMVGWGGGAMIVTGMIVAEIWPLHPQKRLVQSYQ